MIKFFLRTVIWTVVFFAGLSPVRMAGAQNPFGEYCQKIFAETKNCPADLCHSHCLESSSGKSSSSDKCEMVCSPKDCTSIPVDQCPGEYCSVMTNCIGAKICHFQMTGERPACGDLAYAGQEVDCCPGMIRRCGVEFLDGSCDMEGKNSIYSIPICLPCGDGICGQFEDKCNCPEDCSREAYNPIKDEDIKYLERLKAIEVTVKRNQSGGVNEKTEIPVEYLDGGLPRIEWIKKEEDGMIYYYPKDNSKK